MKKIYKIICIILITIIFIFSMKIKVLAKDVCKADSVEQDKKGAKEFFSKNKNCSSWENFKDLSGTVQILNAWMSSIESDEGYKNVVIKMKEDKDYVDGQTSSQVGVPSDKQASYLTTKKIRDNIKAYKGITEESTYYYDAYQQLEQIKKDQKKVEKNENKGNDLKADTEKQEEMKNWSVKDIVKYYKDNNYGFEPLEQLDDKGEAIKEAWYNTFKNATKNATDKTKIADKSTDEYQVWQILLGHENDRVTADTIYKQPLQINDPSTSEASLNDMVKDADSFTAAGTIEYEESDLQKFSKIFYDILLAIGIFAAVIVGAIIGIKLMFTSSSDEKAEAKQLLVPYIVGCVVVFGGFGIWKLVITLLQGV